VPTMPSATGWVDRLGDTTFLVPGGDANGLSRALTEAANKATSSAPWIILLQPGIYQPTAQLTLPSYTCLLGAGRDCTRIDMANVPNGIAMVGDGTVNLRFQDIEIYDHRGSGGLPAQPLSIHDAQGFSTESCRFDHLSSGGGGYSFIKQDTSSHSSNSAYDVRLANSQFIGASFDNIIITNCNLRAFSCLFQNTPTQSGSDNVRLQTGGTWEFYGCDIIMISSQTYTGTPGAALQLGSSTTGWTLILDGCRVLFDLSSGDVNGATVQWGTIATSNFNEDYTLTIIGSKIDYKTGTITSAAVVAGLVLGNAGANATNGSVRLIGSEIRDLGGSGGTVRTDVVINGTAVGGNKILKSFTQSGSRAKWDYKLAGGFIPVPANYGYTDQTTNFQAASAAFATAATVAVTLGTSFPASALDYNVHLEPSANETFWVSGKTNTGFTLNSSNATSTATVRYVVVR